MSDKRQTTKNRRREFATKRAPRILRNAGLPTTPLSRARTRTNLSEKLAYFEDPETLVVTFGPEEGSKVSGMALVHGLHQANNRRLVLVVPRGQESATALRLPWVAASSVKLWTYDEADAVIPVKISKTRSLAQVDDELEVTSHEIGDRAKWVEPLVTWASKAGLTTAHRKSYLAWHYEGRMVLKIASARRGALKASAGVHYSKPRRGKPVPVEVLFTSTATEEKTRILINAAQRAVDDRKSGRDVENREHHLQALLGDRSAEPG